MSIVIPRSKKFGSRKGTMKCPKCGTAPHSPLQIKAVGMCYKCEDQIKIEKGE